MKAKVKTMQTELENCGLLQMFELEVVDNRTGEIDHIICDIFIKGNRLIAQRVAFTQKEERSKFIAHNAINIDTDFTLDQNLEALMEDINTSIIDSEFYSFNGDEPLPFGM